MKIKLLFTRKVRYRGGGDNPFSWFGQPKDGRQMDREDLDGVDLIEWSPEASVPDKREDIESKV